MQMTLTTTAGNETVTITRTYPDDQPEVATLLFYLFRDVARLHDATAWDRFVRLPAREDGA